MLRGWISQIGADDFHPAGCAGDVGPTADDGGLWSVREQLTAFLPVPALSGWAKVVLFVLLLVSAVGLVIRGRRAADESARAQ